LKRVALVVEVGFGGRRDVAAGEEGAVAVETAGLEVGIDLRHQSAGLGTVGQGYVLFHQPDDVAGQLRHLRRRQGNAGNELVGVAEIFAITLSNYLFA